VYELRVAGRNQTSGRTPRQRLLAGPLLFLLALLLAGGMLGYGPGLPTARADGTASQVSVDGTLDPNGTLRIEQQITFSGSAPQTVSQTFETSETVVGDRSRHQDLSAVTVTAGDQQLEPTITEVGDAVVHGHRCGDQQQRQPGAALAGAAGAVDDGRGVHRDGGDPRPVQLRPLHRGTAELGHTL
jgi:hypothetical protein